MITKPASRAHAKLLIVGLVILVGILWAITAPERRANAGLRALQKNQQKWNALGIGHYQFTLESVCLGCGEGPLTIEVKNGVAVSITNRRGEQIVLRDEIDEAIWNMNYAPFTSVESIFDFAQSVLSEREGVRGEYDAERGFPTDMCFYNCGNPFIQDGFISIHVRDFRQLP